MKFFIFSVNKWNISGLWIASLRSQVKFFIFSVNKWNISGLWIASLRSQWRKRELSLRRPKACGNLGLRDNYSFMEFFLFFVFVLTFCSYGLLRRFTPRNDSIHKLVIARLWKSRGNLSMGYSDNQTKLVIARVTFAISGNPLKYPRNFISKTKKIN